MKRRLSLIAALCLLWLCAVSDFPAATASAGQVEQFQDVSPKSPFYQAIDWAVRKGITKGTSDVTFSPSQICNRQQILTFLWRYKGKPRIGWNVFTDAPENNDFREAANWAYQNGYLGNEVNDKHRELNGTWNCTRLSAVTYLWLMAGRPDEYGAESNVFEDIDHSGNGDSPQQELAVGWAVAKGITNGTSSAAFSPESTCTRGQIVTFLYRYDKAVYQ